MSEKKHYFDSRNTQPKLSYKYLENLKRESRYGAHLKERRREERGIVIGC